MADQVVSLRIITHANDRISHTLVRNANTRACIQNEVEFLIDTHKYRNYVSGKVDFYFHLFQLEKEDFGLSQ